MKKRLLLILIMIFMLSSSLNAFPVQNRKKTFSGIKANYSRLLSPYRTESSESDLHGASVEIFISYFVYSSLALRWDVQFTYFRPYRRSFSEAFCLIPITWNLDYHPISSSRLQPYLSFGWGAYVPYSNMRGHSKRSGGSKLGIVGCTGIEYFFSPEWSFGLELKYHRILLFSNSVKDPTILDLGVRVNVLW